GGTRGVRAGPDGKMLVISADSPCLGRGGSRRKKAN
ncbi:MAG: hypothetical protein ACI97A_004213, partial [Planctomycetota bacterium]